MNTCDKCGSIGLSAMQVDKICDDIHVIICVECLEIIVAQLRAYEEEMGANEMFGYVEMR